jgi:hypothetical protein
MNAKMKLGLALTLLGIISLVLSGVKFESRQEVFRVGDFQATATTEKSFPFFRYIGVAFVAAGCVLLFVGIQDKQHK